ncbi:MAG: sodium-dependent transporter [Porticoccaceae bacterium]|nr:sodium-dependent transporter [Porticoccaceae bacterium]
MQRGQFSSRLAFILAASGSAVGLGNIWGFPTNAAENGGGAFLLMYLILAFALAYPALMAELIIGRHNRSNMASALQSMAPAVGSAKLGRTTGLIGVVTASMILCFYSIVAGWMIAHMLATVARMLAFNGLADWLVGFSLMRNVLFATIFVGFTLWVISAGVEQGIEKWSRRLMPSLLALLIGLIIYVLMQDGAMQGLRLFLIPNFSQLANPELVVNAMGQAFFSMSLGVGTMLIYGSYLRADENLPVAGALVTLADTGVAVLAGMLVLPALFVAQQLGVEIYADSGSLIAGPDLIFRVLPSLFASMGATGPWVALAFFVLMSIAALTSSISMLEVPVSWAVETRGISRLRASWMVGIIVASASAFVALYFDALFGLVVDISTVWAQPLLSLMLCVFCGWLINRNTLLDELKKGCPEVEAGIFWRLWPPYVKVFCPLLILLILAQSFIER